MSSDEIEPYDWYRRFFGRGRGEFFDDMFRGFDQMRREMEGEFEDIEKTVPKDLVREYDTPQGGKVIEEGCSMIRTKGEPGTGNIAEAIRILNK